MKALILAAGFGTRLGYLTQTTPKALVRVGGKAIVDHNIRKLLDAGVTEILINTHYLVDQVEEFLKIQPYGECITTIFEAELLGTAGTVKANWAFFEGADFLVMHGGNYFEADLKPLLDTHKNRRFDTDMTLATFDTDSPELCGTVLTDKNEVVVEFFEKITNSPSVRANAAIYILSPNTKEIFFNLLPSENDISINLIPKLIGRIQAHFLPGDFIDIGSPAGLARAKEVNRRARDD